MVEIRTSGHDVYLSHLRKMVKGNERYMIEIITLFLRQLKESLRLMEESLAIQDWQEIYFQTHKIRSTIKLIDLQQLQRIVIKISERCHNKPHPQQLAALFEEFKQQAFARYRQIERRKSKPYQ